MDEARRVLLRSFLGKRVLRVDKALAPGHGFMHGEAP